MTQNLDQFVSREEYDNLWKQVAESLETIKVILEEKVAIGTDDHIYMPDIHRLQSMIGDIEH
ncbi:hypothetical protein HMPREF9701_01236 [Delftia acidovorans CCUG 274B]|uniref:hypothetical protein n=1 Tax=Delftia TaxID=80865 RepID=UPI00035325D1|nr:MULTISPECIES: hypothetical protein [Delftia]EPD42985.1 hypothetical protein HMPREF9701_01236 [Delftia acidovorans CCUG 274B]